MSIPVLLMECPVAGFQHHEGELCWKELRTGQPVALVREPGNRHDARAIRVHWHDRILGYVPREANYAIAQALDRGERLEARISLLRESSDPWQRVTMQVIVVADPSRIVPRVIARAAHRSAQPAAPKPPLTTHKPAAPFSASQMEKLMLLDLKAWLAAKAAIKKAKDEQPREH
jgi:hypothetical protein